jgi:hypothetical protein
MDIFSGSTIPAFRRYVTIMMTVMIIDYDKLVERKTDHCSTLNMTQCLTSSSRRPT